MSEILMREVMLETRDAVKLCVHVFDVENPKAVVQCIHGMEEHQGRYEEFARALMDAGYAVVTSDLRGHGLYAPLQGHIADKNGAQFLINDQLGIREYIGATYPDVPVILFAHSMGTLIARNLLRKNSGLYTKVVLSGYPNYQDAAKFGGKLARLWSKIWGVRAKSPLLEYMSVGSFNKQIKKPKTPFDWLSYNEFNVEQYQESPLCGQGFTTASFIALFDLVVGLHDFAKIRDIKKDLPFLLVSGAEDPCTGGETGRKDSFETLQKYGFDDISVITYEKMRHEILNEKEKRTVMKDIIEFLNK